MVWQTLLWSCKRSIRQCKFDYLKRHPMGSVCKINCWWLAVYECYPSKLSPYFTTVFHDCHLLGTGELSVINRYAETCGAGLRPPRGHDPGQACQAVGLPGRLHQHHRAVPRAFRHQAARLWHPRTKSRFRFEKRNGSVVRLELSNRLPWVQTLHCSK